MCDAGEDARGLVPGPVAGGNRVLRQRRGYPPHRTTQHLHLVQGGQSKRLAIRGLDILVY